MTFKTSNSLNVTVLMGGTSFERAISLDSGQAVVGALREAGHKVTVFDLVKDELPNLDPTQIIFPVMHGPFGEDGQLQKLLENADFNFVGCGSRCSELLMNKVLTSEVASQHGILMPKTAVVNSIDAILPVDFKLPLVVKPATQGSSIGLSLVHTSEEWKPALVLALKTDSEAVVQEFIEGIEIAVGV
ncbi:MAG: D-alanine--D-alanine ligase, partial [Lentisphaeria bacterium]|nr:D-alanine--D-alanine ligase [Lentisphaeria bacterium]